MMTREEIRAVYDQGQEAVIAPVEQLYVLIAQHQEQIAQLQGRVKERVLPVSMLDGIKNNR